MLNRKKRYIGINYTVFNNVWSKMEYKEKNQREELKYYIISLTESY
jgi:hypothetical protein